MRRWPGCWNRRSRSCFAHSVLFRRRPAHAVPARSVLADRPPWQGRGAGRRVLERVVISPRQRPQGNRIWSLRLKAGSTSWGSGAVNSDRGCRNAEEPASVRSFARRKGSSAVNHLPDFSYAIALPEWLTVNSVRDDNNMVVNYVAIFSDITAIKSS